MNAPNVDTIYRLEQQLQQSLRPVQPDPAFVQQLQVRLANPGPTLSSPHTAGAGLLLTSVGIAVGMVLFWMLRRLRNS